MKDAIGICAALSDPIPRGEVGRSVEDAPKIGSGRLSAVATAALLGRLRNAATELFATQGFHNTSMDQIARRAGASTKTLYSRYRSKAEVMIDVVQRSAQHAVADRLQGFSLRPENCEPRYYLCELATEICDAYLDRENVAMQRVILAEAVRYPILQQIYREATGLYIDVVAHALTVWQDTGALDSDLEPRLSARLFLALTEHEIRIQAVLGEPMTRVEVVRFVEAGVELFLSGVGKVADHRRSSAKVGIVEQKAWNV